MSDRGLGGKRKRAKAAGSGKGSARQPARGKPFEPGNPYRWQPGQSGNPVGSSRKQMLSAAYRAVLSHPMPPNLREHIAQMIEDGAAVAEVIAWAMASGAIKGNVPAAVEFRKATEIDIPRNFDDRSSERPAARDFTDEELLAILSDNNDQD